MNTPKRKITKPASDDPWREAKDHPSGPNLMEMLNGQEEIKLRGEHPEEEKSIQEDNVDDEPLI